MKAKGIADNFVLMLVRLSFDRSRHYEVDECHIKVSIKWMEKTKKKIIFSFGFLWIKNDFSNGNFQPFIHRSNNRILFPVSWLIADDLNRKFDKRRWNRRFVHQPMNQNLLCVRKIHLHISTLTVSIFAFDRHCLSSVEFCLRKNQRVVLTKLQRTHNGDERFVWL